MLNNSTQIDAIAEFAKSLQRVASAARHRRCLLLSGCTEWCITVAERIQSEFKSEESLWVSHQPPKHIHAFDNKTVFKSLGAEADLVVYDAHSGFDADAFGAVSGLIRAGGLLLLLAPPLAEWPQHHDPEAERFFPKHTDRSHFIERFISVASQAEGVFHVVEHEPVPAHTDTNQQPSFQHETHGACRTADQELAVETIKTIATGQQHKPIVLISDRGRGKSSALGIAAAQLLQQGFKRILVTGPRLDSVMPVFERAWRILGITTQQRGLIEFSDSRLEYIAPDELIASTPAADLILVDEAATIPTPMLSTLLAHYKHIVFATTVHGYEGTGRGFALRFNKVIDQQAPGWQQIRMHQPIRWSANDPLERFVFNALLLNASIASEDDLNTLNTSDCHTEKVGRDQLMRNEDLLSQVFGLLVLAHYRTRPNDLRQLLDSSGLQLHVMRYQMHIVGVVLLIEEGGIEKNLTLKIYQGRRRLHGHLIPQSLATHAGMVDAPGLRYLRIMRIAIHPAVQRQGIGSKLITETTKTIKAEDYDCIGTSFGVTVELYHFWKSLGFVAVRLGLTREHSSGTHSLVMLKPVSGIGRQLAEQAHTRMQIQLPYLLADALKGFDTELASLLTKTDQQDTPNLNLQDWQDIISFAYGARGYEFCLAAVTKLVIAALNDAKPLHELDTQQQQLLQSRVVNKRPWAETVKLTRLSGRAAAINLLRKALQVLVESHCPEETRTQVKILIDL